jgi:phage recombination protein Bet
MRSKEEIIKDISGMGYKNDTNKDIYKLGTPDNHTGVDFRKGGIVPYWWRDNERIVDPGDVRVQESDDFMVLLQVCGAYDVEEEHNPLDCESIPEEDTYEDIHGPVDEPMCPAVEHQTRAIQQTDSDLTNENVRKYICPTATDNELFMFLKLCEARNLNPFIKEAYLVKYNNSPATLIVGKDAFTKKAEDHPAFDGFEAGIIIKADDGKLTYRAGQFVDKGEHLVGGWADVHRNDRKVAFRSEVSMTEYNTGKSSWAKIPATMIRKVALVQALREAFPSDLGGCYDSAEMDQARK